MAGKRKYERHEHQRWSTLPEPLPLVLTTNDVAELLGSSAKHVRDLCTRKEIQAVQVGSVWRIPTKPLLAQLGIDE